MVKHKSSEARRAQLFQAALEVCVEKGYHATRMDDIAARAGLSKGSLYHHFDSKEDLFLELLKSMIDEFKEVMIQILRAHSSAATAFERMFEMLILWAKENPGMMKGMMDFYLLGSRSESFRDAFLGYYEELVIIGTQTIQMGIDSGEFSSDLDAREAAWILFTGGDGILSMHIVLGQEELGLKRMTAMMQYLITAYGTSKTSVKEEQA